MALERGTTLGTYQITDLLGKGGMGEVYRARDSKLGREVAIKVLPAELAQDPERLARLEREARMLAALNHPNVASIYGLEQSEDTRFLVLELVEGETLADRLKRGAIPVEQSLDVAVQIADALEAAHDKGVVHRDLKPANIKITPEGRVKVLDFGLAKAFVPEQSDVDPSHSPTLSMAATRQGIVLGTAGYMAPEQASGEVADHRADIWAFGVVLFEMLSGRGLFTGKTVTHVLASVMKEEPDWSTLPPGLHPRIRFLLERCLAKEPRERCQSMGEARAEFGRARTESAVGRGKSDVALSRSRSFSLPTGAWVTAIALAAVAGAFAAWMATPEPAGLVRRFDYDLPEGHLIRNPGRSVVDLSSDGRQFIYNTTLGLLIRPVDEFAARVVPGTESPLVGPFFSPDGQTVGYWDVGSGELRRIAVQGGAAVRIAASMNPFGARWEDDGTIVYAQLDGIWRVPATGGTPTRIVESGPNEALDGPDLLPGGEWVLFTSTTINPVSTRWDQGTIVAQRVGSGERITLWEGGGDARYLPTGHIVYALGGDLYALPFDLGRMEVSGSPVTVIEGVQRATTPAVNTGSANYAVSETGTLIYLEGPSGVAGAGAAISLTTLVWLDRDGNEEAIPVPADGYLGGRVSPDGTRIAVLIADEEVVADVWVLDLATLNLSQLTFDGATMMVWADNDTVLFSDSEGKVLRVAGTGGAPEPVGGSDAFVSLPWSMSPDGRNVAVVALTSAGEISMGLLPLDGSGEVEILPVANTPVTNEPAFAPNGEWIAFFEAPLDGSARLNVRPFPDVERTRSQVGPDFARHPVWSTDGSELYYFDGQGVVAVPMEYEPGLRFGAPESLLSGPYWWGFGGPNGTGGRAWDPDPTSDRFFVVKTADGGRETTAPAARRINIVLDWFQELKERVPVR